MPAVGSQQCGAPEPLDKAFCCSSVNVHIHRQQPGPQLPSPGITRRNESAAGATQAHEHSRACCVGSWSRLSIQGQVWEPPDLAFWSILQPASRDHPVTTHRLFCGGQERSGGRHSWSAGSLRQANWRCPALKGRDRQKWQDDFHRVEESPREVMSL